ncbi:MAG: deoxyguanosinetriphosphate triphosphohydrolase [Pseudomonadota bacterium]
MSTMNWNRLLNRTRYHSSDAAQDELGRSPFHKDHDKVVFSGAFRRLGRKTQVHPLSRNDHVHTRLTHSLEASCVGRSLGMRVGELLRRELPSWAEPSDLGAVVQAACLAHDIGNPPFGHAGEYAIRDWFLGADARGLLAALGPEEKSDLLVFEGNAQGFRTVTQIEYNQFEGGMRLTSATLGALMKYPYTSRHAAQGKYGVCRTELHILEEVAERLGLVELAPEKWCRHPLAWLTEAADDVCYAVIDLEDGNEMDILDYEQIEPVFRMLSDDEIPPAVGKYSDRRRLAAWRGKVIERCVTEISSAFVRQQDALLAGTLQGDLIDYCHPGVRDGIRAAKQLARENIFNNHRKTEIEIGAFSTIAVLLEAYSGAVHELHARGESSFRNRKLLGLISNNRPSPDEPLYLSYMRIIDFIAGMTDNFAIGLAHRITGNRYD